MRHLILLFIGVAVGFQPPPAPQLRGMERPRTTLRAPLLTATTAPANDNVGGNLAAGIYSGLATVIDCAAFTSIVFAPVGLPLTVGLQHALMGFAAMQIVATRFSGLGFILAPTSYEVMPFLAQFASVAAAAGASGASLLATVLAGSVLVGLLGAVLVAATAEAPVDKVEELLPPALQAGLFGAIGWSLYLLAFDSLGLSFSLDGGMLAWSSARLWLPANLLGIGLWFASRSIDSPWLFPGFIGGTTAVVHGIRMLTGTSIAASREGGWLMAAAAGAPVSQLWSGFAPDLIRWDILSSTEGLVPLLCACLFGPVVNTVLNCAWPPPQHVQLMHHR